MGWSDGDWADFRPSQETGANKQNRANEAIRNNARVSAEVLRRIHFMRVGAHVFSKMSPSGWHASIETAKKRLEDTK
jgi:hypothetical protein